MNGEMVTIRVSVEFEPGQYYEHTRHVLRSSYPFTLADAIEAAAKSLADSVDPGNWLKERKGL